MPEVELTGCSPEPLMNYLKSLGILRLVSEQSDPGATACWSNEVFIVRSNLDQEQLIKFFINEYRPTPIIGPWAGGSGFFGKDNRTAVDAISSSKSTRAADYRAVIESAQEILREQKVDEKPNEQMKRYLLCRYRREMPDEFVQWMDAAMVLQADGQSFAPLLGTGGNDGRLDFTQNFMQRLVDLNVFDDEGSSKSKDLLLQSLFGEPTPNLGKAAVGQFSPGRAGGPNATQGMEGNPTDNPWDFVLMLEGALLLAGSVVRRLGIVSSDKAAFPFTVRARPVGEGSPSEEELSAARGELWLPLWDHYVSCSELESLFAEGRADLAGKPARDSVDFARAVAGLGVDRGIHSFTRYGILKRSGKAYLAMAMERFAVPQHPREATDLIRQLDNWLDRFRRASSAKGTPKRFGAALRRIESAIFDYCRYGRREDMEAILIALGRAERELAVTAGKRGGKQMCRPLARLSPEWIKATHDLSPEFSIALALAGIYHRESNPEKSILPIRSNIEPVTIEKGGWAWSPSGPHVVWTSANLVTNMGSVLARRMMDGSRVGCDLPPLDFKRTVSRKTVAAFLAEQVDDRRIQDLLWGLLLIDHRQKHLERLRSGTRHDAPPLPREYALLKLLFLPRPLMPKKVEEPNHWNWQFAPDRKKGLTIRPEPRVLALLWSGRVADACRIAYQRLRSSGFKPLPYPMSGRKARDREWKDAVRVSPLRLSAALLLPIGNRAINEIVHLVTRQDEEPDIATLVAEGETVS